MSFDLEPWKKLFERGLFEDRVSQDWTSMGIPGDRTSRAKLIAKQDFIWSASPMFQVLEAIARDHGVSIESSVFVKDGQAVSSGQIIVQWVAPSRFLLGIERTFLNIVAYLGGVTLETDRLCKIVSSVTLKTKPRVVHTRKILPGLKSVVSYAVRVGGGHPHRLDLASGILIKENHIAAFGGIAPAIEKVRILSPHGLKIEVEVRNPKELEEAIKNQADIVLLDNFNPTQIKEIITGIPETVLVEVSGGIQAENIRDYCIEGVDIISAGSISHSVKNVDLSLVF